MVLTKKTSDSGHKYQSVKKKDWKCTSFHLCGKVFETNEECMKHIEKEHLNQGGSNKQTFTSPHCPQFFMTQNEVDQHRISQYIVFRNR